MVVLINSTNVLLVLRKAKTVCCSLTIHQEGAYLAPFLCLLKNYQHLTPLFDVISYLITVFEKYEDFVLK